MSTSPPHVQRDWNDRILHDHWPAGRDNRYILARLADIPAALVTAGPALEVGASHAVHSCEMSRRGFTSVALEPSAAMLARARTEIDARAVPVALVRGIAETLPFRDRTFGHVLCWATLDHLADPRTALREMARVLREDGRLVVGVVNYGGLTARLSRSIYRGRRALGIGRHRWFFWDTPVPFDHTFECTYPLLLELGRADFDLEQAFGVSIGWALPGWRYALRLLPGGVATRLLQALDRLAGRAPGLADYVVTLWRPKGGHTEMS